MLFKKIIELPVKFLKHWRELSECMYVFLTGYPCSLHSPPNLLLSVLQRITQGITRVRLSCDNTLYGVFGLFIAKNPAINQIFRFIFSAQPGIRTRQPQAAKNVHLYDNYVRQLI